MAVKSRKAASRGRKPRQPLGREAWLEAARSALIEEGTAGVEINKLATRLGVSRGGFYWFFTSRDQLLDELLAFWARTSTVLFERMASAPGLSGLEKFEGMVNIWIEEKEYDPKWDGAVRDWARTSAAVRKTVQAVDQERIAYIERIFHDLGYAGLEAHMRARVTYYHQIGYYALGIRESRKLRLELRPYYTSILTQRSR